MLAALQPEMLRCATSVVATSNVGINTHFCRIRIDNKTLAPHLWGAYVLGRIYDIRRERTITEPLSIRVRTSTCAIELKQFMYGCFREGDAIDLELRGKSAAKIGRELPGRIAEGLSSQTFDSDGFVALHC